jgi:SUKH-4 immunity protein
MTVDLFDSVRRALGDSGLLRAPQGIVAPLRLPEKSKEYLTRVGLPGNEVAPGIDFNLVERLPKLGELYPDQRAAFHASWEYARFLRLKHDVGVYFDEDDGGTVWELDVVPGLDSRFVNTAVELLGYFLAEYNLWSNEPVTQSSDDAREALIAMRTRMLEADPRAFADPDHFWSLVLEDAELYL